MTPACLANSLLAVVFVVTGLPTIGKLATFALLEGKGALNFGSCLAGFSAAFTYVGLDWAK